MSRHPGRHGLGLLLALGGTACSSLAPPDPPAAERRVEFHCSNGESLAMRFFPGQGRAVLLRGGAEIVLQQQPSGSGFVYGNGPNTVRGKGDDLTVEIGRMVPIRCQAR